MPQRKLTRALVLISFYYFRRIFSWESSVLENTFKSWLFIKDFGYLRAMGLGLKVEGESCGIHDWRALANKEPSEDILSKGPIASILLALPHWNLMMTIFTVFVFLYISLLYII